MSRDTCLQRADPTDIVRDQKIWASIMHTCIYFSVQHILEIKLCIVAYMMSTALLICGHMTFNSETSVILLDILLYIVKFNRFYKFGLHFIF